MTFGLWVLTAFAVGFCAGMLVTTLAVASSRLDDTPIASDAESDNAIRRHKRPDHLSGSTQPVIRDLAGAAPLAVDDSSARAYSAVARRTGREERVW